MEDPTDQSKIEFIQRGWSFKDKSKIGPITDAFALRDEMFKELVLLDRSALTQRLELLGQIVAVKVITTFMDEVEGSPVESLDKLLYSFQCQLMASLFVMAREVVHGSDGGKAEVIALCSHFLQMHSKAGAIGAATIFQVFGEEEGEPGARPDEDRQRPDKD